MANAMTAEAVQARAEAAAAADKVRLEAEAASHLAERLDEAVRAVRRYLWLTPAQADTIALLAAVTHVTDVDTLVSAARVLFTSERENVGKTTGMMVGVSLSYSPLNTAGGTVFDVRSAIFEAATAGLPCPTLYRDEISSVFGKSGINGDTHPVADWLRRGYRAYDAAGQKTTIGRSTNRTHDTASIFSVFWLTGLRVAIPRDIRTRTIVIQMEPAPAGQVEEFDLRDSVTEMIELRESLAYAVRGNRERIRAFRIRSLRRRELQGRKGEIWEGVFAVAAAACPRDDEGNITDPAWLNRAMAAFTELATDRADEVRLSPEQVLVKMLAEAVAELTGREECIKRPDGRLFVAGRDLREEIREADRLANRYSGMTDAALGKRMSTALRLPVEQVRQGDAMLKGYYADDIEAAWDRMAPSPVRDVVMYEDDDIYA